MANPSNVWIKRAIKKQIQEFGGVCAYCGADNKPLEFAHIQPTNLSNMGRGRKERYYDRKKNPNSYVLLDKDCHSKLDAGKITVNDLHFRRSK